MWHLATSCSRLSLSTLVSCDGQCRGRDLDLELELELEPVLLFLAPVRIDILDTVPVTLPWQPGIRGREVVLTCMDSKQTA